MKKFFFVSVACLTVIVPFSLAQKIDELAYFVGHAVLFAVYFGAMMGVVLVPLMSLVEAWERWKARPATRNTSAHITRGDLAEPPVRDWHGYHDDGGDGD